MTNQRIVDIILGLVNELRNANHIPYLTGNLANNALRVKVTKQEVVIFIDQSIAPYAPYTNEPWISPKWKGTPNPNAGWWERFCEEFTRRLAQRLRGEIKS